VSFREGDVRAMGRSASGVRGMLLRGDDEVIALRVPREGDSLLVVTEQGFGKRTDVSDFPVKHRATGGVISNSLNADTGDVAAIRLVGQEDEELMLITELGTILRTEVGGINRYRRASRGVTVMKPQEEDRIVSITVFVDNRPPEELDEPE
jgi:DNA gyrase subunit A